MSAVQKCCQISRYWRWGPAMPNSLIDHKIFCVHLLFVFNYQSRTISYRLFAATEFTSLHSITFIIISLQMNYIPQAMQVASLTTLIKEHPSCNTVWNKKLITYWKITNKLSFYLSSW